MSNCNYSYFTQKLIKEIKEVKAQGSSKGNEKTQFAFAFYFKKIELAQVDLQLIGLFRFSLILHGFPTKKTKMEKVDFPQITILNTHGLKYIKIVSAEIMPDGHKRVISEQHLIITNQELYWLLQKSPDFHGSE